MLGGSINAERKEESDTLARGAWKINLTSSGICRYLSRIWSVRRNYITNVLKNEDEALRLIVIWRSRWWKERSLSVTAHRRHWIRRLLLLFYFGIPVSRPLLIVLPIVMVMHFVSVCCDHDLMFLDLDEVNFIFDVSCKQNLYIIDRETADPVLGMGIGANRQYSCYQFIIFIFKWCII